MFSVCFVCLGNICRSPVAEGAFRALVTSRGRAHAFHLESAGTGGWHVGEPADARTRRTAKARGLDLTRHRAQQFRPRDFERFDLVVAMDRNNERDLLAMARTDAERAKAKLFRAFVDERARLDVPDPYYGEEPGFFEVIDNCEEASSALLAWLDAGDLR